MNTRIISAIPELQNYLREVRAHGRSLALVPTMGALHEGHRRLICRAKQQCDTVVVSVYVNRRQFSSADDFARYPRNLRRDTETLQGLNVDAVFAPNEDDLYPKGFDTLVEPGALSGPFEGAARPGHFRGVTTVVLKLFNLVQPDVAYFGQKDFQQVQIIRRMVEDLNLNIRLVVCPIVREPDGLALSSRNALLSGEERKAATVLHRSLLRAEQLIHAGEVDARNVLAEMRQVMEQEPRVALDYLALVEALQMTPVERVSAGTVALIAARVGSVRLIDNLILGPPGVSPDLLLQLAFAARPVIDPGANIPGLQTDALCRRIETCRECAALSSVMIPPREFLAKYLKRDYPDLNRVRVMVIGRDAPIHAERYFYQHPERPNRFAAALYALLGVRNFSEFRQNCVFTDAVRCHVQSDRVPEKALTYCARHLRDELQHFPNLDTVVLLGPDAYQQFQREVLDRKGEEIRPWQDLLKAAGWAEEDFPHPLAPAGRLHAIYCYHPVTGYLRSPSIAAALPAAGQGEDRTVTSDK